MKYTVHVTFVTHVTMNLIRDLRVKCIKNANSKVWYHCHVFPAQKSMFTFPDQAVEKF